MEEYRAYTEERRLFREEAYEEEMEEGQAEEDPYRLKKKSVRGGSWKDPESMIRSVWRSYEYQNQPRSYIGFRCVRSVSGVTNRRK